MVKNSLLDAYRKHAVLRSKLYRNNISERLKKRYEFYKQERIEIGLNKTLEAFQEFSKIESELRTVFENPEISKNSSMTTFSWLNYYRDADQLLYNKPNEEKHFLDIYNELLFEEVVKELNKKFPDEQWKFGEVPLYHWQILNWPGYEESEEEIEEWESNPNISKDEMSGDYIEKSALLTKCIYQEKTGELLKKTENNLSELADVCREASKNRRVYTLERDDNECSGGYELSICVEFEENATGWYDIAFTPQEKVMNDTIVREIDTRLEGTKDMAIVHERLGKVANHMKEFLTKYNLEESANATPSGITPR